MTRLVVVGAGGQLGSRVLHHADGAEPVQGVDWRDSDAARRTLRLHALRAAEAGSIVVWCAGAGVVGASEDEMAREVAHLGAFLDSLVEGAARPLGLVLTSSAGGVHGGTDGVVHEATPPCPISAYGRGKVEQEELAVAWSLRHGVPVVIARVSNIYGPGARRDGRAGLVTTIVRRTLEHRPVPLYMPLDTLRDYVYVDDAALMLLGATADIASISGPRTTLVVSERPTSIGAMLSEVGRVLHRRPLVAHGSDARSQHQPGRTVFRRRDPRGAPPPPTTPLAVGIHRLVLAEAVATYSPGTRGA